MIDLLKQLDLTMLDWAGALLCALLVGFTKTGIVGLGVVIVPVMAMVFPAQQSPGILLPMLFTGDIVAVSYYHRHARWKLLIKPIPWAVAGILIGFFTMKLIDWSDQQYSRIIGAIVAICIILKIWQNRTNHLDKLQGAESGRMLAVTALFVGLLGGFATMVANAAGPILIMYLLILGLPKFELVGTGAWFFLLLNFIKVPLHLQLGTITGPTLAFNLCAAPLIVLGGLIGIKVLHRINQKFFNSAVLWLAIAASLKLLLTS